MIAACSEEVVGFADLYRAYAACRRGKGHAHNTMTYEAQLLDRLIETRRQLNTRQWRPSRTLAFAVNDPKPREIHAADFADRVVHHWLVPRIEAWYEPLFIHDSYANRKGKGIHSAVDRLRQFIARVGRSGKKPVWILQLDIANFFNSIDRRRLEQLLRTRGEKVWRKEKHRLWLNPEQAAACHQDINYCLWLCRTLLNQDAGPDARERGSRASFARVPAQKRLKNARPGCGLPIGNLSSQLFANIYLNELDQLVKHQLKCRHYLRYMDDFLLLSEDPDQLLAWRASIQHFLRDRLGLAFKALTDPVRASDGVDFLGYLVRPYYTLPRRRVLLRFERRLKRAKKVHCRVREEGIDIVLSGNGKARLQAQLASYLGHLKHANSYHLIQQLWRQHNWLQAIFEFDGDHCRLLDRSQPWSVSSLRGQLRWFRKRFPQFDLLIQIGREVALLPAGTSVPPVRELPRWPWEQRGWLQCNLRQGRRPHLLIVQQGYLKRGLKRRLFHSLWYPITQSKPGLDGQAENGEPLCPAS